MKKIFRPKIMIICNGSVAEPQYFQSFKDFLKIPASIKIISNSTGSDSPWRLIERAIKVKGNNNGTEIWCIFDIDQYLGNNEAKMRAAFKLAAENGIFLAWSNICFELWILLHFIHFNAACGCCDDYNRKIKQQCQKLGLPYRKNANIFQEILPLQATAIKNAKSIASDKMETNPSTQVYKLVERLNKLKIS